MTNSNKKKNVQLKMSYGKANNNLRKAIMFQMIQKAGLDICFQCGKKIETINELSIEHKIPWLDSDDPVKLYFDLDNIAFSHLKCNAGAAIRPTKGNRKHPSIFAYQRGCRCPECRELNRKRVKNQRKIIGR